MNLLKNRSFQSVWGESVHRNHEEGRSRSQSGETIEKRRPAKEQKYHMHDEKGGKKNAAETRANVLKLGLTVARLTSAVKTENKRKIRWGNRKRISWSMKAGAKNSKKIFFGV